MYRLRFDEVSWLWTRLRNWHGTGQASELGLAITLYLIFNIYCWLHLTVSNYNNTREQQRAVSLSTAHCTGQYCPLVATLLTTTASRVTAGPAGDRRYITTYQQLPRHAQHSDQKYTQTQTDIKQIFVLEWITLANILRYHLLLNSNSTQY